MSSTDTPFSDLSYEEEEYEEESSSFKEEEVEEVEEADEENRVETEEWKFESEVPRKDYSADFHNDSVWERRNDMLDWARQVGRERMMVLTIKISNQRMVRLAYNRSGWYRFGKKAEVLPILAPTEKRTRQNKCGCNFELLGVRSHSTEQWTLSVVCGVHNHDLPNNLLGHSFMGRMTNEQKEVVWSLSYIFVLPRAIVDELRTLFPGNVMSTKQVSNLRRKFLLEDRRNMTVTEWSLYFLERTNYRVFSRRICGLEHVDILFFVHPTSLHLLKLFPYVDIMDNTYKTNRYDMALLEMVGFTCTSKSFNIGFVFLSKEDTDSYTWVLSRLKRLFEELGTMPNAIITDREKALMNAKEATFGAGVKHLLCWVHVKTNILAYAIGVLKDLKTAKRFASRCWGIFMSSTEATYEERLRKVKARWGGLMNYVEKS